MCAIGTEMILRTRSPNFCSADIEIESNVAERLPYENLLLEVVVRGLENAGLPHALVGSVAAGA